MKKCFIMLAAGFMAMTFIACSDNGSKKAEDSAEKDYLAVTVTANEDTMSQNFGKGFGAFVSGQVLSDPTAKKLFDKEAFIKGLELVMKCDTSLTDMNFLGGIQQGLVLMQQLSELEYSNDVTFDRKKVVENVIAALNNDKVLSETEIEKLQKDFNSSIENARNGNLKQRLDDGSKFAADKLASDKNLKKTKSGLIYKITKQGSGANFKINDNVTVKYKGMHIDGSVFDQNTKGSAMKLNEQTLIPGFVELLQLMNPGAKAYAIMPAAIAYGTNGSVNNMRRKDIKGNETLVFEVETVGIAKEEKEAKK